MRQNTKKNNIRRSSARFILCQDVKPNSGHNSIVVGGVGVLRHRDGGIHGSRHEAFVRRYGLGDRGVQVNAASSVAKNMSPRRAGRLRHVDVRELWVQEKVRKEEVSIIK